LPEYLLPAVAELLHQGQAAYRAQRLTEAQRCFEAVLATEPQHAQAMALLGAVLAQRNELAGARSWLTQAVALAPSDATAHGHLARVLAMGDRLQDALFHADQAATLKPDDARARLLRANLLHELGRHADALADFDFAISRLPEDAEWHYRHGQALAALRRPAEALASFDRAMMLRPDSQTRFARAVMLQKLGRLREAVEDLRRVAAQEPGQARPQMALAYTLMDIGEDEAAVAAFDRAYQLAPMLPLLAGNRRNAKLRIGDWRDYEADREAILAGIAQGHLTMPGLTTVEADPAQHLACARLYAARQIPAKPPMWTGDRAKHDRLRIAYVSKDLRQQASMLLATAMFERHDRSRFETFAISLLPESGTPLRTRLEAAFDHFHHAENLGDKEVAELIRRLEIDIAVDLDGFTRHARNGIFGYRPAPIAVGFLGYPGTIGSPHIDYIIADRIVLPEDEQKFYDEQVVYMPVTYQPNTERTVAPTMPSRRAAGLPETGFVFCCFNSSHKITPPTFESWMRILGQAKDSVLWLLDGGPAQQANLRREAQQRGVAGERLIFAPPMPPPEHMARQALAGLFLDTLPYNAHTTASDALWCGVPVLTLKGNSFAGRVAASLNHAIGMHEMTVRTPAAYEALAVALAHDPVRLADLKARLAANRDGSALFDIERFTRQIEEAYEAMWERHIGTTRFSPLT
jgi:predicted O-linked N-acetylglucosamine transferase (SPINDLY family)